MGLCYCHKCEKDFHPLGIMRHRSMHRDKEESITITFSRGDTYSYNFSKKGEVEERRK